MGGSDTRALSRSLLDLCRMRKLTIATAECFLICLIIFSSLWEGAVITMGGGSDDQISPS